MLAFLGEAGFSEVVGIDLSEEQVEIAVRRGLDATVADVFESLAAARGRFNVIMAIDFMEHFSKDELVRLVPALYDALEPNGYLILQTPNGQGLFPHQVAYGDLTHLTIFTPSSLQQLLRLFGFGDFQFGETGPVAANWKGRLRGVAWGFVKAALNAVRMVEAGKSQAIWTENMICRCQKLEA